MTTETDTYKPLEINTEIWYSAELGNRSPTIPSVYIFVKMEDGTEGQFLAPEMLLYRANYFNATPPGTPMRVRLGFNKKNRPIIVKIDTNPNIPPRPDARHLPWLNARLEKTVDPQLPYLFLTVIEVPNAMFNQSLDVYTPKRLLEQSGYPEGLKKGQEIGVRLMHGDRGLSVIQVRYPPDFKHPGQSA